MKKSEIANAKHKNGYNCAQSVACAFADELGVDESLLYKMTEGFGAGMGTTLGVCGALSGAAVVVGLVNSDGNIEKAGQTKAATTRKAGQIQMEFADKVGEIFCKNIKTAGTTSCSDCIAIATELVEDALFVGKSETK